MRFTFLEMYKEKSKNLPTFAFFLKASKKKVLSMEFFFYVLY